MAEGLLDQYREKLKKAIGTARFYGLPDRLLEKVFVELTVIEDFEIPRDAEYKALMDKELRRRRTLFPKDETEEAEEGNPEKTDEEGRKHPRKVRRTVKPEELLEAGKRSQVVGAPGCGKTTLLRWLALQTAKTSDQLPVFIELKRLQNDQFNILNKGFSKFLFENGVSFRFDPAETPSKELELLEGEFNKLFASGSLVVLLDGLDEIAESERHRLRNAVEKYANHHEGGLTLIISTRPYGYLRNFADLKAMEIESLSNIQIGQFLDHWCEKSTAETVKAHLRKNPNLRSLARFPFLLAFIAHLNSVGDLPQIEFYQKIIAELIDKLDKDKGIQKFNIDDPNGVLKHRFLKRFAFDQLFERQEVKLSSQLVFHTEEILKVAQTFLREEDPTISPCHLVHDVCATPLLRQVEGERYTFAHLTIQEFLAAEELSKRKNCHKLFTKAFFNRQLAEMEVLPMTIGLADDPNEFYELLSKNPESFDFIKLCLEGRSLRYHRKKVGDSFLQMWQMIVTDIGLREDQKWVVFSNKILTSFTGIEKQHYKHLTTHFLDKLLSKDPWVRLSSIEVLSKLGAISPEVVTAIENTLCDKDSGHALITINTIGGPGNASPEFIPVLINVLRGEDIPLCVYATQALGYLGAISPNVIPVLENALFNEHPAVSIHAAKELIQLGVISPEVVSVITNALHDQNSYEVNLAFEALGKLVDYSSDFVPTLANALRDENGRVRKNAAKILKRLRALSSDLVPILINALSDQESVVRLSAAETLVRFRAVSPDVISALTHALPDEDELAHEHAAEVLVQLGTISPDLVPALLHVVHNEKIGIQLHIAKALVQLGADSPDIIAALKNALLNQNPHTRSLAAKALGKLKADSPDVVVALTETLRDKEWLVGISASVALGELRVASPAAMVALTNALRDQNGFVRMVATEEIIDTHKNISPDVVPSLVQALLDQLPWIGARAAKALGRLGAVSPDVFSALENALRDKDGFMRHCAAEALGKLGPLSPNVIRALILVLRDHDFTVYQSAAETLERIGFDSPAFCEGLKLLLASPSPKLKKMALRSIGYPSTDPGLLDDLKKLTKSRNPKVREAAEDAYNKYKFKLEMLGLLPA